MSVSSLFTFPLRENSEERLENVRKRNANIKGAVAQKAAGFFLMSNQDHINIRDKLRTPQIQLKHI